MTENPESIRPAGADGAAGGHKAGGHKARGIAEIVIGAIYLVIGLLFLPAVAPSIDTAFFGTLAVVGVVAIADGIGTVRAAGAGWRRAHGLLIALGIVIAVAGSLVVFFGNIPERAGVGFALGLMLWVLGAIPLLIGLRTWRELRLRR
ncbi:hypothetical protein ET475_07000 [Microbacterium protaetiae]|uniref:DUF308 domain-containing protein n=1 Tax=Microbacterium protaetiae TaxID=2509458 RepID=A0A4P6EC15_9MICO|nr:hypothetical protein [Microbacterium protaetiae]QAY59760.1 hypothetical protein ET475_07000 [Microbacterium protaetiae]